MQLHWNQGLVDAGQSTLVGVLHHGHELAWILFGGLVAYAVTNHYMLSVAQTLFERNLFGFDINKTTAEQRQALAKKRKNGSDEALVKKHAVPESLGILCGAVYLSVVMMLVIVLHVDIATMSGPLTTITVMLLLGFVDDVLDVRWRYKLFLSAVGSIPLIMAYDGSVSVLVPPTLTRYVESCASLSTLVAVLKNDLQCLLPLESSGMLLSLGPLYLVYLAMLCIFCTNSINIVAGINGLEVGQSIVIAAACAVYNLVQLRLENVLDESVAQAPGLSPDHQLRALVLLVPFIGTSAAMWCYNKYPARVFVGDSYTYFAGTVLAVSAITGVYSKTLLLFFTPQIFNFIISTPQLFGFIFCPRHRVPRWVPETDKLTNSYNYTILNAVLCVTGDLHEKRLTAVLIGVQVATCLSGFIIRYWIASWMYEEVQ